MSEKIITNLHSESKDSVDTLGDVKPATPGRLVRRISRYKQFITDRDFPEQSAAVRR